MKTLEENFTDLITNLASVKSIIAKKSDVADGVATSKSYTDSKITTLTDATNTGIQTALDNANVYTDQSVGNATSQNKFCGMIEYADHLDGFVPESSATENAVGDDLFIDLDSSNLYRFNGLEWVFEQVLEADIGNVLNVREFLNQNGQSGYIIWLVNIAGDTPFWYYVITNGAVNDNDTIMLDVMGRLSVSENIVGKYDLATVLDLSTLSGRIDAIESGVSDIATQISDINEMLGDVNSILESI